MWIDITIIILIVVGAIYTVKQKSDEYYKKSNELENKISMLQKEKTLAVDKCYADMKKKQHELIEKELQYCFGYDEFDAKHYCNVLVNTVNVNEFFSAKTIEERKKVFDEALTQYEELPEHLKSKEDKKAKQMFARKYTSNKAQVLSNCEAIIDRYEPKSSMAPSCKEDLMKVIKRIVDRIEDIEEVSNEEIEKLSWMLICSEAFELLVTGEYHYHRGSLSPMKCGVNMEKVYYEAMDMAVELGYNDEKSKNETLAYYIELKNQVG